MPEYPMIKIWLIKKITIFNLLVLAIVVISANLLYAFNLEEYYPLNEGNSWTYSVIEDEESYEETVRIEGKEIINNVGTIKMVYADKYKCIAFDLEGFKKYKDFDGDEYEIFEPPKIIFPNNMKIAETKKYSIDSVKYNLDGAKIGETKEIGKISLESIEDIDVPAGKFSNCLKFSIISEEKKIASDYDKDDCSVWLAPGIGRVKEFRVKTEYNAETQKEDTSIEIMELVSALVDGKRIGRQE